MRKLARRRAARSRDATFWRLNPRQKLPFASQELEKGKCRLQIELFEQRKMKRILLKSGFVNKPLEPHVHVGPGRRKKEQNFAEPRDPEVTTIKYSLEFFLGIRQSFFWVKSFRELVTKTFLIIFL